MPIDQKESVRWLDNVRQSTELLGDPGRCVHIGDRESDIDELFCTAHDIGTHFLIRTCVDRLAGDGGHTIADEMEEVAVRGLHASRFGMTGVIRTKLFSRSSTARSGFCHRLAKQKKYPALTLTVIHAEERGEPKRLILIIGSGDHDHVEMTDSGRGR